MKKKVIGKRKYMYIKKQTIKQVSKQNKTTTTKKRRIEERNGAKKDSKPAPSARRDFTLPLHY